MVRGARRPSAAAIRLEWEPTRWWTRAPVRTRRGACAADPGLHRGQRARHRAGAARSGTRGPNPSRAGSRPASSEAEQVVLLVLDGLGWEQLREHASLMPVLSSLAGECDHDGRTDDHRDGAELHRHRAGALPSTACSATGSCSVATCSTCCVGPSPGSIAAGRCRRARCSRSPPSSGHAVPVVSPTELQGSAFTEAHLRGSKPVGWRAASAIAVEVRHALAAGERFVYAYYGGVDKTAHERGFGEFYEAELRFADRVVASVLEVLPAGAVLLVTADHGQVQVGDRIVVPDPDLLAMVAVQSGEGRFRWLHATPGAADDLVEGGHRALRGRRLGGQPRSRRSTSTGSVRRSPHRWRHGSVTSPSCRSHRSPSMTRPTPVRSPSSAGTGRSRRRRSSFRCSRGTHDDDERNAMTDVGSPPPQPPAEQPDEIVLLQGPSAGRRTPPRPRPSRHRPR